MVVDFSNSEFQHALQKDLTFLLMASDMREIYIFVGISFRSSSSFSLPNNSYQPIWIPEKEQAAARMSVDRDEDQENATLDSFTQYLQNERVVVHPSVQPYHFPGHGLGIRATGLIEVCRRDSYSAI